MSIKSVKLFIYSNLKLTIVLTLISTWTMALSNFALVKTYVRSWPSPTKELQFYIRFDIHFLFSCQSDVHAGYFDNVSRNNLITGWQPLFSNHLAASYKTLACYLLIGMMEYHFHWCSISDNLILSRLLPTITCAMATFTFSRQQNPGLGDVCFSGTREHIVDMSTRSLLAKTYDVSCARAQSVNTINQQNC